MAQTIIPPKSEEKKFFTSGWINSYSTKTEVDGNTVEFQTGSIAHKIFISPPAYVSRDTKFLANSVLKIAFTITSIDPRLYFKISNNTVQGITSATGLMQSQNQGSYYATATGSDVLTVNFSSAIVNNVGFWPADATGNESGDTSATIIVTGLEYNGALIFGSVTPPSS